MLDLKPEYLAITQQILAQYVPDKRVLAYGSRVTGQAHEASDLDLVIINTENMNLPEPNLTQLRSAFSDSNLPILIDIHDWARIPESFRAQIQQAHTVLKEPAP